MEAFLLLGFVVGMGHALEADHVAAVAALGTERRAGPLRLAALGASWGLGHATTLLVLSLPAIVFGWALSGRTAAAFELAVGLVIVMLGLRVLWRLRRDRVHFHVHDHGDGRRHFHAHSHAGAVLPHDADPHMHRHPAMSWRAWCVGLLHGAAGSAGLVALAAASADGPGAALGYVVLFGLGATAGMAGLTFLAGFPLRLAERTARGLFGVLQFAAAVVAIVVGLGMIRAEAPIVLFAAPGAEAAVTE